MGDKHSFLGRKNEKYESKIIDINKLHPSEMNADLSMDGIDDLKASILDIGLTDDLIVAPNGYNEYEILAGHRRYEALSQLVKEKHKEFKKVPCKVLNPEKMDLKISNKAKQAYIWASTNTDTRQLTANDRIALRNAWDMVYDELKKAGKDVGRKRDFIARHTGLSAGVIAKDKKIEESLTDEAKDRFMDTPMSQNQLSKISQLDSETQNKFLEYLDDTGMSAKDVDSNTLKNFEFKNNIGEESEKADDTLEDVEVDSIDEEVQKNIELANEEKIEPIQESSEPEESPEPEIQKSSEPEIQPPVEQDSIETPEKEEEPGTQPSVEPEVQESSETEVQPPIEQDSIEAPEVQSSAETPAEDPKIEKPETQESSEPEVQPSAKPEKQKPTEDSITISKNKFEEIVGNIRDALDEVRTMTDDQDVVATLDLIDDELERL